MNELQKTITDLKKVMDARPFKFELLIAFWLAVHLEKLEFAKFLHEQDHLIERVLSNLRKLGRSFLLEEKERKEQERLKAELEKGKSSKKKDQAKKLFGKLFDSNK